MQPEDSEAACYHLLSVGRASEDAEETLMNTPLGGGETTLEDLRQAERTIIIVRWVAAAFALAFAVGRILTDPDLVAPAGIEGATLGVALAIPIVNLGIWLLYRRATRFQQAKALAVASLGADVLLASAIVWLHAFDTGSALWTILLVLPLEGAIRFRLRGALSVWLVVTSLYLSRELWGSDRYGYELEWNSIVFRMGIALLIALVGGFMARDLIRQRTRLTSALQELNKVDELRSRLISTLAHDVRSPLTTIRGTLKLLLSNDRPDDETAADLVRTADGQAARLERLAIDLLDLARLESGRLELALDDIKLREAVKRAVDYAAPNGGVEISVDAVIRVRADPGRLEQMVVNLVGNAIRYGGPPVSVEAETADDGVEIRVRDHGPGVPREDRVSLFDPFRMNAGAGSFGFGLAIVKALAEAHGGRIAYEPNEPQGACFSLTLPRA